MAQVLVFSGDVLVAHAKGQRRACPTDFVGGEHRQCLGIGAVHDFRKAGAAVGYELARLHQVAARQVVALGGVVSQPAHTTVV